MSHHDALQIIHLLKKIEEDLGWIIIIVIVGFIVS